MSVSIVIASMIRRSGHSRTVPLGLVRVYNDIVHPRADWKVAIGNLDPLSDVIHLRTVSLRFRFVQIRCKRMTK